MSETHLRLAFIFPVLVPAIRDYVDILNNVYDSVSSDINLQQILQQSFIFLFGSIKFTIIYFLSFQWIQDLTYLPILVPQIKIEILKEHFFLQTPQSNFFTFLEIPSYIYNKFFLGFLNSFFLCLPLSVAHIISTRRLLIQGRVAGIFSSLGTICGQIVLLICILFGGRFFITPWFNFQVLNYFFGLCLILNIVYDMAHERSIRIIDLSNKSLLIKIFLLNFMLAWTEQSCIFQYFGNLTLGAEPSIIEIFSSPTELQSILTHLTYIYGIIAGSLLFTSIFIFLCLKINNLIVQFLSISYYRWIRRLNFSLITLILALTFTSIPFYSVDYLIFSNFGFVSQDKSFKNTIFSATKVQDFPTPILGDSSNMSLDRKTGISTDITPFDKGRYLIFDVNDSFEQLNYQGEYAWLTKRHRIPTLIKKVSASKPGKQLLRFVKKIKLDFFYLKNKNSNNNKTVKSNLNNESNNDNLHLNSSINNTNSDLKLDNSMNILNFRNTMELKINEFFEPMINSSFQNRFMVYEKAKKPIFEKNFKNKYYSNPVYKLLLNIDIDSFLSRQPYSFALNKKQENELFEKRLILANYYDSLRYYNKLSYIDSFQDNFNGSKSYADRIYNQQFKGTLKIVRRLFSITLNSDKNNVNNLILKFDQPLYKKLTNIESENNKLLKNHSIFHEELGINKNKKNSFKKHEITKSNNPFIQLTNSMPFYVGWDEQLRKLIITNRLSPKYSATSSMKFVNKNSNNDYPSLNKLIQKSKTIEFSTWPISKNIFNNSDLLNQSLYSYNFLFGSVSNLEKTNKTLYTQIQEFDENIGFKKPESVPENIVKNAQKTNASSVADIIPYTGGGFVWPGHFNLKFNLKNVKF